jgi:hypothetical protein
MGDQRFDGGGCLGRVLIVLGIIWLGAVVFAGFFGLRDNAGSFATLIGSTLPGLLLIGVGRTMSRRAAERRDAPTLPQPASPPTPPSPPATQPTNVLPKPRKPAPLPNPEPETPIELPPPQTPSPPKTSQQMIEEAHKRWGGRPRPDRDGV